MSSFLYFFPGNNMKVALIITYLLMTSDISLAIPGGQAICYAGCAVVAVACFAAAGAVFGTVTITRISENPALIRCNNAFGTCERNCMRALG